LLIKKKGHLKVEKMISLTKSIHGILW